MKPINLYSVKGGVGLTTVVALLATHIAQYEPVTIRVDDPDEFADLACTFGAAVGDYQMQVFEHGQKHIKVITNRVDAPYNLRVSHRPIDDHFNVMVVDTSYVGLRRVVMSTTSHYPPDGLVVVTQPARALSAADASMVAAAPVIAELTYDPHLARMIDAGMLLHTPKVPQRNELSAVVKAAREAVTA
jgi:MinD-like ATPase involved in chromosome partitioning or flagellar assembly